MKPGRAIIIGGSLSGLLLGNILSRRGWEVEIFERVAKGLENRGAGLARHPEMQVALEAAGVRDDKPGIAVKARVAFDRAGEVTHRYAYDQILTSWGHIYNSLRAVFPDRNYHGGKEFVRLHRADGHRPVAHFADGTWSEADLIVGADGYLSVVRGQLLPDVTPSYAGYVAWRGVMEERDLPHTFVDDVFDIHAFCFPPGSELIGYAVAGPGDSVARGQRRYTFLWYRPIAEESELDDLLTGSDGRHYAHSLPPSLIRPEHVDALLRDAANQLAPSFAAMVASARRFLLQPIYDVETPRMALGDVALIGDAAFVARPHVGIGVLKGALNALELADRLDDSPTISDALAAFEGSQLEYGRKAVAFARSLGSFMERGLPQPESDPSLGLTKQFILENSARPVRGQA